MALYFDTKTVAFAAYKTIINEHKTALEGTRLSSVRGNVVGDYRSWAARKITLCLTKHAGNLFDERRSAPVQLRMLNAMLTEYQATLADYPATPNVAVTISNRRKEIAVMERIDGFVKEYLLEPDLEAGCSQTAK